MIPSKAAPKQRAKGWRGSGAFATGAEQCATERKRKSAFAMGNPWMPCAIRQILHKSLQKE